MPMTRNMTRRAKELASNRLVKPLCDILAGDRSATELSFSAALGFTCGICPIMGFPFILCWLFCKILLRKYIDLPTAMMATTFVAAPFQVILMVLFMSIGKTITGWDNVSIDFQTMMSVLRLHPSIDVLHSLANAAVGYALASPGIMGLSFLTFIPFFTYSLRKYHSLLRVRG